jgi:hypothetical protein
MDPFLIELFDEAPLPIIRVVFALASETPSEIYHVPERSSSRKHEPSLFTSYDIWCAGIFPETSPFICNDGPAYRKLLDRTCFGLEYDLSGNHEVKYPKDVAKKKDDLFLIPCWRIEMSISCTSLRKELKVGPLQRRQPSCIRFTYVNSLVYEP